MSSHKKKKNAQSIVMADVNATSITSKAQETSYKVLSDVEQRVVRNRFDYNSSREEIIKPDYEVSETNFKNDLSISIKNENYFDAASFAEANEIFNSLNTNPLAANQNANKVGTLSVLKDSINKEEANVLYEKNSFKAYEDLTDYAGDYYKKQYKQTDMSKGSNSIKEMMGLAGFKPGTHKSTLLADAFYNDQNNKNELLNVNNRRELLNALGRDKDYDSMTGKRLSHGENKDLLKQAMKAEHLALNEKNKLGTQLRKSDSILSEAAKMYGVDSDNYRSLKEQNSVLKQQYKSAVKSYYTASDNLYNANNNERNSRFYGDITNNYGYSSIALKANGERQEKLLGLKIDANAADNAAMNGVIKRGNLTKDIRAEKAELTEYLNRQGLPVNNITKRTLADGTVKYYAVDGRDFKNIYGQIKHNILHKGEAFVPKEIELTKTETQAFLTLKELDKLEKKEKLFEKFVPTFSLKNTLKTAGNKLKNQTDAGKGAKVVKGQMKTARTATHIITKPLNHFANKAYAPKWLKAVNNRMHISNLGKNALHDAKWLMGKNKYTRALMNKVFQKTNVLKAFTNTFTKKFLNPIAIFKKKIIIACLPVMVTFFFMIMICGAALGASMPVSWVKDENKDLVSKTVNDMLHVQESYLKEMEAYYNANCQAQTVDAEGNVIKLHPQHSACFCEYNGDFDDVYENVKNAPDYHTPTVRLQSGRLAHYNLTELYKALISVSYVYLFNETEDGEDDAAEFSSYCCRLLNEILHNSKTEDVDGVIFVYVNDSGLCNAMRASQDSIRKKLSNARGQVPPEMLAQLTYWIDHPDEFEMAQEMYEETDEEWIENELQVPGLCQEGETGIAISYETIKNVEDALREKGLSEWRIKAISIAMGECGKHIYGPCCDNSYLPFQLDCSDFVSGVLATADVPGANKDDTCYTIAIKAGEGRYYRKITWSELQPGDILVKNLAEGTVDQDTNKVVSANHVVMYVGEIPGWGKHCVIECSKRYRYKEGIAQNIVNGVAISGFNEWSEFKNKYNYQYVINPYYYAEKQDAENSEASNE